MPTLYPETGANADVPFFGVNKRASQVVHKKGTQGGRHGETNKELKVLAKIAATGACAQ